MRGCPAISYGWGRGHVRAHNRAFRRFGLAQVAATPAALRSAVSAGARPGARRGRLLGLSPPPPRSSWRRQTGPTLRARTAAAAIGLGAAGAWCAPGRRARRPGPRERCSGIPLRVPGGIALTFDDGPHPEARPTCSASSTDAGVRATFYLVGEQVERYPALAAEVAAAGHEVGIHGYRHTLLLRRSPAELRDDFAEVTRLSAEETDLELMVGRIALRGWEVNPGQKRALVYFGGNGEDVQEMVEPLSSNFPEHTSYLLAYRGYGASDGKPSERVLTADALAVFDYAAKQHRGSVDVVGRSLGSGVAVQVAACRRVRRLVLITPFDSMAALAAEHYPRLPARPLLLDRWDSAAVAHELRAPVLVVRAGRDKLVFPSSTDRLLEALPAEPRVLNMSRRGHNTVDAAPTFWPAIVEFLAP